MLVCFKCITNVGVKFFLMIIGRSLAGKFSKSQEEKRIQFSGNMSLKYFRHSLSVLAISMEEEVCVLVMQPLKLCKGSIYVYIYVYVSM